MTYSISIEDKLEDEDNKRIFEIINDYNWEVASVKADRGQLRIRIIKHVKESGDQKG